MKIKKNLIGFEPISERFCKIRSKGRFTNITMLSAHAITRDKDEMEKKQAGNGLRLTGKEEDCTGSHSPQWTIVLEEEERDEEEEKEEEKEKEENEEKEKNMTAKG
jgi:hypothetical protein